MTQGRIWHALQPNWSMLTILVHCSFTPLLWPPCTRLIYVSTLGVFIRPQWSVVYPQSFYNFTMQVNLACPLGIRNYFLVYQLISPFFVYLQNYKEFEAESLDLQSEKYGLSFDIKKYITSGWALGDENVIGIRAFKVGVNPSLKEEMWLLMHLISKKTCAKMYKSIHFWNQKNQMNPMVATDFCKIMWFSRNWSVAMVTIEFFLESITKIWFY